MRKANNQKYQKIHKKQDKVFLKNKCQDKNVLHRIFQKNFLI